MAQTNYTPISLYYSATATNVPVNTNLVAGELAINTADGKLFYKDSSGVVQVLATKATGTISGSTGYVQFNNAGVLGSNANFFWDNTNSRLGIGTSSPSYKLEVSGSAIRILNGSTGSAANNGILLDNTASASPNNYLPAINWNTGTLTWATIDGLRDGGGGYGGTLRFNTMDSSNVNQERMRIDSSGNLLVGTTSSLGKVTSVGAAASYSFASSAVSTAGAYYHMTFNPAGGAQAGFIYSPTSSTTVYSTTSDYRLKTVIGAVSDAGQRIDALEPIEYNWNNGTGRTKGFLAHKFAEVYPNSVSGKKDAVDADGKPIYQGMQASTPEVMADLIAEIQSLRKRVATLEAK
jgi:hypothetical protein